MVLERVNNPEYKQVELLFLDSPKEVSSGFETPKQSFFQSEDQEFQSWLDEIETPASIPMKKEPPVEMSFGQPANDSFDVLMDITP